MTYGHSDSARGFIFSLFVSYFDCGCSCGTRYGMMLKRKGRFGADIPKRFLFEFDLLVNHLELKELKQEIFQIESKFINWIWNISKSNDEYAVDLGIRF